MTKHKRMLDSGNESVCENTFEILTSLNFSTHFRHENKTIFAFHILFKNFSYFIKMRWNIDKCIISGHKLKHRNDWIIFFIMANHRVNVRFLLIFHILNNWPRCIEIPYKLMLLNLWPNFNLKRKQTDLNKW